MPVTGPAPWPAALDRQKALFDLDGAAWADEGWADRIETALTAAVGPYRRIAVASKILHLKRPRLILA